MKTKRLPPKVKEVWESNITQYYENNVHISYSQLMLYDTCPRQWEAQYLTKEIPILPSIHMTFGTAIHETIQRWLETLYHYKVKDANEMELDAMLYENMIKAYLKDKERNDGKDFTDQDEIKTFFDQGVEILKFIKNRRSTYFTTKGVYLAGIEKLLYVELAPNIFFKGKIDLVLYDERVDEWTIIDIKTSTSGWNKYQKADDNKKAQVLLYKYFFSQQFNIPLDKIKTLYFIVKREVPSVDDVEFASMRKRVQEFKPADGKIKIGQALNILNNFRSGVLDSQGNLQKGVYSTKPSKDSCKFCELKKKKKCPDAVY